MRMDTQDDFRVPAVLKQIPNFNRYWKRMELQPIISVSISGAFIIITFDLDDSIERSRMTDDKVRVGFIVHNSFPFWKARNSKDKSSGLAIARYVRSLKMEDA